ncbi:class I SAM-dependent methyltransferase [soil metagenome]
MSEDVTPDSPPRILLKPKRARPFFARHPWVFQGSIARVEGNPAPGAEVVVVSQEGQFVARGLFNPKSAIRVRLYRWEDAPLDEPFWQDRLEAALRLRSTLPGLQPQGPGTAYRAVYSESDGLSGLTVDRYDRWLVAQFTSRALADRSETLCRLLTDLTGAEGILLRYDRTIAEQEGLEHQEGPILGTTPAGTVKLLEHGIEYNVDLLSGQKTGFYLDQRDNRMAVAAHARGRRVLDLFCYSGGFALNALKNGGASWALGIDSSAPAIEQARQNAVANGIGSARFEVADVFEALERLRAAGERFGLVICDPPKFARGPAALEDALKGYLRLNRAAVDVLEPDGILATCSCSGLVDRTMFADLLARVAELSGRPIQLLERRGQAHDHPVSASCLETESLKCEISRVG